MTTKTAAKAPNTAKDATAEMTNKVTDGAREFVKRTADSAQERAQNAFDTSKTYNTQIEDTLKRAATGYVNILGGIAEAAFSNVNHTLAAVEKLAEAKSVSDAVQIQTEFVREHSAQNMEHVRSAYDYVRDVAAENAGSLRDGYAKIWPSSEKKAA
ncbi:MAG: phasin family protein [Sulfitobacter sp.]